MLFCFRLILFFLFFKQKTAYEMRISDWSSDVCSSDLLPDMKAKKAGAILNFGSVSWMIGQGGMAAYTACKSAVIGLTRSLARDYGPHGIRVNEIGRASCRGRVCQYV